MKVKLKRFKEGSYLLEEFEVTLEGNPTVLEILSYIKENLDPTLSYRAMCRSAICGTCAVKVNGEHRLACNTRVESQEVLIEPVDNAEPIRDLVVSHESIYEPLKLNRAWLLPGERTDSITPQRLRVTAHAWDCILCGICNCVCPPLLEGKTFGGPMLLTRLYKILEDPRDSKGEERLHHIKDLNPQECVHCSNCSIFCPKACMPERWITLMENKLVQKGLIQKKGEDFGFLGF